jgi:methylated-DNA-[protein]-cysteine S-methyltransferase
MLLACTERGLAGAWFEGDKHHPPPLDAPRRTLPVIEQALEELQAYWEDARHCFSLPLDPQGSEFQLAVWAQLLRIAPGRTRSYGEVAAALGRPQAARAVGSAVGRNPLSIIIPCHRVLGASGALTGYAAGLDRKIALLRHETGAGAIAD